MDGVCFASRDNDRSVPRAPNRIVCEQSRVQWSAICMRSARDCEPRLSRVRRPWQDQICSASSLLRSFELPLIGDAERPVCLRCMVFNVLQELCSLPREKGAHPFGTGQRARGTAPNSLPPVERRGPATIAASNRSDGSTQGRSRGRAAGCHAPATRMHGPDTYSRSARATSRCCLLRCCGRGPRRSPVLGVDCETVGFETHSGARVRNRPRGTHKARRSWRSNPCNDPGRATKSIILQITASQSKASGATSMRVRSKMNSPRIVSVATKRAATANS
jgi:hypothetical protein